MLDQTFLGAHHVGNGNNRETGMIRLSGIRVNGLRSGRTGTTTDNIGTDHKIFIGIDRFSRSDHLVPPARLFIFRGVAAADMGITGKRMSHQNRVGSIGIEGSGGFIADIDIFEFSAAIKGERRLQFVIFRDCNKDPGVVQVSFDFITSCLIYHNQKYNIAHKITFSSIAGAAIPQETRR